MAEMKRDHPFAKLAVLGLILVGGVVAVAFTPLGDVLSREGIQTAIEWLRGSPEAPLVYIVVYTAATAIAMPGSVLTLAGGAMFGVFWGTIYTTIAANLGANAAFGIGRSLGREGVERIAGDRLAALDRATENHGFRGMLTLRLIPVVPFNALNFGAGLTSIRWPAYAAATAIGIFPGTVVYTMFADALLAGSTEASRDAFLRVLISGALLVLLSFLPAIAKRIGVRVPGAAALLLVLGLGAAPPVQAQTLPDHRVLTEALSGVIHGGTVDYTGLKENRGMLDGYLAMLAEASPEAVASASQEAQLAFWINAYNACMLRLVVDHYPIVKDDGIFARIRNAVAGRPENSVWQIPDVFTRDHCRIAGEERSQDEIEHEIIRPMGEPRIHFAVNCAAVSCPPLSPNAYLPEQLDEQLDRVTRALVANPVHYAREGDVLRVSKVMDWFKDDFGGDDGLREFLASYASPSDAAGLRDGSIQIDFFEYDWTLNDTGR